MINYFPILTNIDSDINQKFRSIGEPVFFKKGAIIVEAGVEAKGIYYIIEGKVDCFRISFDGRKKTTLIEASGAVLSDMPVYDGEPQPCNYQALEDVKAIYVDKEILRNATRIDPVITDYIMRSICKKFRAISNQLMQLCFDDAGSRVAYILQKFAEQYGEPMNDENAIRINCCLTQQFISELAGINRTTTSRIIALLREDNIMDSVNRKYVIKDMKKLSGWGLNFSTQAMKDKPF